METIIVTSAEALNAAVQEAVSSALKSALPDAVRRATAKPYLTKKELMQLTGWSNRQVEYKKEKRELSYVRQGRTILFPAEAVQAFLDEGLVKAREVCK